jgi:hypothetical protein
MEPAIHNVLVAHISIHRILEMYNFKLEMKHLLIIVLNRQFIFCNLVIKQTEQFKFGLNLQILLLQSHK